MQFGSSACSLMHTAVWLAFCTVQVQHQTSPYDACVLLTLDRTEVYAALLLMDWTPLCYAMLICVVLCSCGVCYCPSCFHPDSITAANEANAAKEKALAEASTLKLAAEREHAAFEEEWRQLTHLIEDDR